MIFRGAFSLGLTPDRGESRIVDIKTKTLTIPEIALIGGTRVALGMGLGLLVSEKISRDARKGAGWALLAIGVLTTVPLAMQVLKKPDFTERA